MRCSIFTLLFTLTLFNGLAQDVEEDATKMDAFTSKKGVLIKFIDYSLPNLNVIYGATAEAKVRKIISGTDVAYFYQITSKGQYDNKTGSIAYEDLIEIIKALESLKNESTADARVNVDYLENKFVTSDGFQIGYYLSKGKVKWYLVLERYGSGNTIFINDVATIEQSLGEAKRKIEQLKNL